MYVHVNVHVCLCVREIEEDSKGVSERYYEVWYTMKVVAYYYTEWATTDLTKYKEWVKVKHNYIIIIICSYVVEGS